MATLLQDLKVAILEDKCDRINALIRTYNERTGKALDLIDPAILTALDGLEGQEFSDSYEALDSVITRIANNMQRLYESRQLS